jgi:hypothetical protein
MSRSAARRTHRTDSRHEGESNRLVGQFPNNPSNPDPSKEVKWGDQSWEEMLVGFYDVAVNPKITNKTIYKKME